MNIHAGGVLCKPPQTRIGSGPAISILLETGNRAVVNHFPTLITPRRIDHLAHRHFAHITRDDAIDESRRVFPREPVFEQRRDIDQRRRIAYGVVLMFVMRLI